LLLLYFNFLKYTHGCHWTYSNHVKAHSKPENVQTLHYNFKPTHTLSKPKKEKKKKHMKSEEKYVTPSSATCKYKKK